ncbi:MAG: metalloregulator ArsR/SmtB family transcription factor [bacterium]|nr:metalloregulator ArsR/SmtB family transcription factor [bacterium]
MLTTTEIKKMKKLVGKETTLPTIFNALSDPRRFQIFQLLIDNCRLCVSDVAKIFGVTVSAASQQLRVLELSGLIRKERDGQENCFQIRRENPAIVAIMKMFS